MSSLTKNQRIMLFVITGENEGPFDIVHVIEEESEVKRLVTSIANTGAQLYQATQDPYYLHMTTTIAIRLGVWIERNMPQDTEEHLGRGLSLQDLKDMDESEALEEVIKVIMKESGRNN